LILPAIQCAPVSPFRRLCEKQLLFIGGAGAARGLRSFLSCPLVLIVRVKLSPDVWQSIRKEPSENSPSEFLGVAVKYYGYYSVSMAIFNPRP
jgi:hypothetical protein